MIIIRCCFDGGSLKKLSIKQPYIGVNSRGGVDGSGCCDGTQLSKKFIVNKLNREFLEIHVKMYTNTQIYIEKKSIMRVGWTRYLVL